jgi:acetyl esterase/lipase
VLAALCLYPDSFNAGRSSYGISELTALCESRDRCSLPYAHVSLPPDRLSHKFESRYPTALLGGTPEEVPQVYHDRSPLYMADRIRAPVIFFQGAEDKVVPPAQSEEIVQAIRKQGGRVSYTLFEGEGHGVWARVCVRCSDADAPLQASGRLPTKRLRSRASCSGTSTCSSWPARRSGMHAIEAQSTDLEERQRERAVPWRVAGRAVRLRQ